MTRMTDRELYNSILEGNFDMDALIAYANRKLAQLDKRNEAARKRTVKKREKNNELTQVVFDVLTEVPMSRFDILDAVIEAGGYPEGTMTVGKIGYQLNKLVREGQIAKQIAIAETEDGEVKQITVYSRPGVPVPIIEDTEV